MKDRPLTSSRVGGSTSGVPAEVLRIVADGGAKDAGGLAPELLENFLELVVEAVAAGRQLGRADIVKFGGIGRGAAMQGVALRALLDLYLSSAWRLWQHLPEVINAGADPTGVVRAGRAVLRAADDVVAALTEGYQLAVRDVVQAEVSARREFVDDLLVGSGDVAGLSARATRFGLHLAGPHAVAVIRADQRFTDDSSLVGTLERSLRGAKADADALVATKDGRLVVVFAAPDRQAVQSVIQVISTVLPGTGAEAVDLRRRADVGRWQIAVGRPHAGATGIRASFQDSKDAFEMGDRLGQPTGVLDAADLLVYRVLLRDEVAIRDLIEATLGPLRQAKGGPEPLLETLTAYFGTGGNSAQTARQMHLSVRAVTYRLARVLTLTGHDPNDPAHKYILQTAVLGARLLGWPGDRVMV